MEFLKVFCVFLLFGLAVSQEGCPEFPKVRPCSCSTSGSGTSQKVFLHCNGVTSTHDLKRVFINSKGTKYLSVDIHNSVLNFIPHELFEGVEVRMLDVHNVTLVSLFDRVPSGNIASLQILKIEDVHMYRGVDWKLLQTMTNLRKLKIREVNKMKVLGKDFVQYAPKSMQEIYFKDTQTTKIIEGAFEHFPNLVKLTISRSPLKELNRNIFPVPFNAKYLSFEEDQLTSLPDDMFSDMPNLVQLSLHGNSLTNIKPFSVENLQYFNVERNPLNCDCDLAWIVKNEYVKGHCSSPDDLFGKDLINAFKLVQC